MSAHTFTDIEMYSDREEDLQKLFAELAAEDETLPDVIQDEVQSEDWDTWGEAA